MLPNCEIPPVISKNMAYENQTVLVTKLDLYLVQTNVYETDRQVLPHFRDSNNELFVKKVEDTHFI